MSVIRDLITECNGVVPEYLLKEIGAVKSKVRVHIADEIETAIVLVDEVAAGLLVVNYEEPCLEFKPLENDLL